MSYRVMIFDDDISLLEICTLILEGKKFHVLVRDTCVNIIGEVGVHQPDLVIMDNQIPDIGGVEATKLLKSHEDFYRIPVIFFSANNNVSELARNAGADFYLSKPFNMTELENMVSLAINKTK